MSSSTLSQAESAKRRSTFFAKLKTLANITDIKKTVTPQLPPEPLVEVLADKAKRVTRLVEILKKNNTEIISYPLATDQEQERIKLWQEVLLRHKLNRMAYSSTSWFAPELEKAITAINEIDAAINKSDKLNIFYTDQEQGFMHTREGKLDFLKHEVGITSVAAGIADTGSLLLVPDKNEPRSLSLVPPVHIAVLKEDDVELTFSAWIKNHPDEVQYSHLVLISGPSKTADIEKRLVYGVHGPCKLVLFLAQ